jgi:hypothetical protein
VKHPIPNLRERIIVRPRLKFDLVAQLWVCYTYYGSFKASGETPQAAWEAWKVRDQRVSRVSRVGRWNRQGCMSWFRDGCFIINSWIGNQVIFGYDPTTDELILKG